MNCALRGNGPDLRKSGPFAPLRGYPCTLAGKVHPRPGCTFPARLKPNTVTFDRLLNTAGKRSCIMPKSLQIKSQEEIEKNLQIMSKAKKCNAKRPPQKHWQNRLNMKIVNQLFPAKLKQTAKKGSVPSAMEPALAIGGQHTRKGLVDGGDQLIFHANT